MAKLAGIDRIGSIELGLQFIENSMATLRPGGVAVHTTEFNLEDGETIGTVTAGSIVSRLQSE